jgi:tetratricopeptide (TPR) repeat protein
MAHLTREEILRACEGGWPEVETIASHLAVCPACRARAVGILGDRAAAEKRAPLLKTLAELAVFEKAKATDRLLAKAEMAELRRLTRGAQKKRVILSRFCHSPAFLDALLEALRSTPQSREESESLANLAVLAAQGIQPAEGSETFRNDRLAMIWIETANARRTRGEWQHARSALLRAEEHRTLGSGDPSIQARWLSIAGSLHCDQGKWDEASAILEESREAYALCGEWPLVGRTLVKMAHCVADDEPERALDLLDRASIYISSEDTSLRSLAERIRTDCLITLGRVEDALHAFREAERLRRPNDGPRADLRATFLAARLLESLGHGEEAEALFDAVVLDELDQGRFNDAVLDLVYIFGFHLRRGSPERAAELGTRAVAELDRRGAANEECRSVLVRLIDAAQGQSIDEGMLRAARDYLRLQWNRASPAEPKPPNDGEQAPAPPDRRVITEEQALVEPLLARARLSRLRRETRREQHTQVARSPEYHTAAFVELLLTCVRQASSRDEAEFTANLALQAIGPMATPSEQKHDLQAQVWTEVANARRIASEWSKASAALLQATDHLAHGTGSPLLKARAQSISASLFADQGRRVEALAALGECIELYERRGAWALVGRTLMKMAHTLVDSDPAQALKLVERAFPMMSPADASLRCLAENIRTDCMIDLGEIELALQTFDAAEPFRRGASPIARRRSDFLAARLLEYLGHYKEAVQLFEAVIANAFDREVYREAFLDLLYLFGVHLRQGATERAVAICRLAIDRLDLFGLGHEQLRTVWAQLGEAAMRRAIRLESLGEVREFLKAHWKTPATKPPEFSFR